MTVGSGALDAETRGRCQQVVVALEHRAQGLDLGGGPISEIGQGALAVRRPSRQPSRRRMAGRELRLGTVSMYMAA
jgi:hypothetical protein